MFVCFKEKGVLCVCVGGGGGGGIALLAWPKCPGKYHQLDTCRLCRPSGVATRRSAVTGRRASRPSTLLGR